MALNTLVRDQKRPLVRADRSPGAGGSFSYTSFSAPDIHRKASCASGGGCPACQAKSSDLRVSQPNDLAEIEADQIADQVMQSSLKVGEINQPTSTSIQRKPAYAKKESTPSADPAISHTQGEPLESATLNFMESRFGHDFSHVRLHVGASAERSAQDLNARAYTAGRHIVFGARQPALGTTEGRRLLAHELTHVLQQSRSGVESSLVHRQVDQRDELSGEDLGASVGLYAVCRPHPMKVKQEGATCWAAALYSAVGGISGSPAGYVEKYKDITDKQGSLLPQHWAEVAKNEGMQFTEEVTGDEITSVYLYKLLTGYGEYCRPLWVAESGNPFAHAYVLFGIDRQKMVRMDPMIGSYNSVDVREIPANKKFKLSIR